MRASRTSRPAAYRLRITCTSVELNGGSQSAGALGPVSPTLSARATAPAWNSAGKELNVAAGSPSAFRPSKVSATFRQ